MRVTKFDISVLLIGDEVTLGTRMFLPFPWVDSSGQYRKTRGVVSSISNLCGSVGIRDDEGFEHFFPQLVETLVKHRIKKIRA